MHEQKPFESEPITWRQQHTSRVVLRWHMQGARSRRNLWMGTN